ncbi:MAG: Ig-like domain-containing protein [Gemmatimonadetes bacterium]|nr:Ig-like domain-containing protein [Gemmatimonadota bacterium]
MKVRLALVALVAALLACVDFAGPKGQQVALSIVPVFDANGFLIANNADQLRIRVQRDSSGVFRTVKDTTVAIDAEGNASAAVNVVLVQSPQVFRVLLDAVRSSDGLVLFSGSQDVTVTSTSGGPPPEVRIPITFVGPRGARVVIGPKDTAFAGAASFSFRATVFDVENNVVANDPVSFYLVNAADASKLTLNRITGAATVPTGQTGEVRVYALSADSLRDTARVTLGFIPVATVVVAPTPDTLFVGGTVQLTATTRDANNAVLTGRVVTWSSSDAAVATVSASGLVTAVAAGTATITATSEGKSGTASILVLPIPAGVAVSPGYANLATGATVALTGAVLDNTGSPITPLAVGTWVSRSPSVASVNATGTVTGAGVGTAVIVASAFGFGDSALVTVPAAGNVVVSTTSNGRAFRFAQVGETIVIDVTADMRFTPSEKLGSYNASVSWNPAKMTFVDVQAGTFPTPVLNSSQASSGSLQFAQANASGSSGTPVLAKLRFVAAAAGDAALSLTISEMSAPSPTFTNFYSTNRVTVVNGMVTVR